MSLFSFSFTWLLPWYSASFSSNHLWKQLTVRFVQGSWKTSNLNSDTWVVLLKRDARVEHWRDFKLLHMSNTININNDLIYSHVLLPFGPHAPEMPRLLSHRCFMSSMYPPSSLFNIKNVFQSLLERTWSQKREGCPAPNSERRLWSCTLL